MSGHSKWNNIKNKKEKSDKEKSNHENSSALCQFGNRNGSITINHYDTYVMQEKSAKTVGQNFIARVVALQTLITQLVKFQACTNTVANFSKNVQSALL